MSKRKQDNSYQDYQEALKRVKKTANPYPPKRTTAQINRARAPMRGFIGSSGEAKFFDSAVTTYDFNTTGMIRHLDIVPTGTTVNSRDGRKFQNTSVQIRGFIAEPTASGVAERLSMYLVWDKQPNKALAAVTDVLDSANSASLAKRENSQRFKIIRKWNWWKAPNSAIFTCDQNGLLEEYVKLPVDCIAECTTADTTGAIGNRITGALLLLTVGSAASGTTTANADVRIRTNFVDI